MSNLENECKSLIESMLAEQDVGLGRAEGTSLALWALKTAMVAEALETKDKWFYLQDERERLFETRTIPQRTTVGIAKCVSQPNVYIAAQNHWRKGVDLAFRAHVTTIAIGALAFQVVTIRVPPNIPPHVSVTFDVSEGPWESVLVQIWPFIAKSVLWPPTHGLQGDIGLHALTDRLNPQSE